MAGTALMGGGSCGPAHLGFSNILYPQIGVTGSGRGRNSLAQNYGVVNPAYYPLAETAVINSHHTSNGIQPVSHDG